VASPAVDRAYRAAQRADDRYENALRKAGITRWSGGTTPAVTRAFREKVRADTEYRRAVQKQREQSNGGRVAKKKTKTRRNGPIAWLKRKRLAAAKKKRLAEMQKGNPGKFRPIAGSTGWMKATAVRFLKQKGKPMKVLIRRAKPRRKSKR